MKPKKIWTVSASVILLSVLLVASILVGYYLRSPLVLYIQLAVGGIAVLWAALRQYRFRRDVKQYLAGIAARLSDADRQSLLEFPIPTVAVTAAGEVIWYNPTFEKEVLGGRGQCSAGSAVLYR